MRGSLVGTKKRRTNSRARAPQKEGTMVAVNRLMLEDVFTHVQADVISELASLLEIYIAQHDVTLLIARKAVCLVRALQKNGYMPSELPGVVFSSRAASFKNMLDVSGRVALVDEVGITLNTVSRTRTQLRGMGCEPDVLLGAICADNDEVFRAAGANARIVRRMSKVDVLEFARAISRYIQLSGITSSCDQPVFVLDAHGIDHVRLAQKLPVANVATEEQRGRDILCETITFDARDWLRRVGLEASGSLVKVRLYADQTRSQLSLVPFVIPGAMSVESVNSLFESLAQDDLAALVPGDSREDVETRLRLVLYGLSRDLGRYALQLVGVHAYGEAQPDRTIERMSLGQEISHKIRDCPPLAGELRMLEHVGSAQIALAVGSVRIGVLATEEHHGTWWLSAAQLSKAAGYDVGKGECVGPVVSAALDLLMDEGLMVPCPTLGNEGPLIRQYRSGEVSRLAREHLQALGGALDTLGIPKEGGTQYRDVVNRLGVLYGRYLEADSDMPTVANPLVFSYLGNAVIVGKVRMSNYDLFDAIERVSANDRQTEQGIVDKAQVFMVALKRLAKDYEPDKNHFGAGSLDDALNLLKKLIEGDARILFEEARLALVSGYHCAVLNGTIDADLKKQFRQQSSELANKPTDESLDEMWVHGRKFDGEYLLYKDHFLKLAAPRRTADDEVVRAKNEVITYLRKAPEDKEYARYKGEILVAKFEILETSCFAATSRAWWTTRLGV